MIPTRISSREHTISNQSVYGRCIDHLVHSCAITCFVLSDRFFVLLRVFLRVHLDEFLVCRHTSSRRLVKMDYLVHLQLPSEGVLRGGYTSGRTRVNWPISIVIRGHTRIHKLALRQRDRYVQHQTSLRRAVGLLSS